MWPGTVKGVDRCQLLFLGAHGRQDLYHILNLFCATSVKTHVWRQNQGINKILNKDYQRPWNIRSLALCSPKKRIRASWERLPENNQRYLFYPHANKHGLFNILKSKILRSSLNTKRNGKISKVPESFHIRTSCRIKILQSGKSEEPTSFSKVSVGPSASEKVQSWCSNELVSEA